MKVSFFSFSLLYIVEIFILRFLLMLSHSASISVCYNYSFLLIYLLIHLEASVILGKLFIIVGKTTTPNSFWKLLKNISITAIFREHVSGCFCQNKYININDMMENKKLTNYYLNKLKYDIKNDTHRF